MIYELTPDAIELGLAAALPAVFELSCKNVSLVGARGLAATLSNCQFASTRASMGRQYGPSAQPD